ncbi:MAG: hypothetical protein Q4C04_08620 [Clostridia bacterium]|nr:hypothetical protein [Clostridia bacterium]
MPYYAPELIHSLGDNFDLLADVRACRGSVYLIFGDRGKAVGQEHYAELFLPQDIMDRVSIRFVSNSCHLPMIENPAGLVKILSEILQEPAI